MDALRALDAGPTVTNAALTGPAGLAGWNVGPVTASLTSVDSFDLLGLTTGPRELYWRVDDGPVSANVTLNGLPANGALAGEASIASDGVHTLTAWGVDNGGNREANKTWTVRIDTAPPVTTASFEVAGNGSRMTLVAEDATSGVARSELQRNAEAWTVYDAPVLLAPGDEVRVRSVDVAGNVEDTQSFSVPTITLVEPSNDAATLGPLTLQHPVLASLGPTWINGELAVDARAGSTLSPLSHVNLTITNATGARLHDATLLANGTDEEGRSIFEHAWRPPWGFHPQLNLTVRAWTTHGTVASTWQTLTAVEAPTSPAVHANNDGSYTVYDDANDNGTFDEGEQVVTTPPTAPCELTGPDPYGYTCRTVPLDWVDLPNDAHVVTFAPTQFSEPLALDFDFPWYDAPTGPVQFDAAGGYLCRTQAECARLPFLGERPDRQDHLSCIGESLDTTTGTVRTATVGTAPARVFVVSFEDVAHVHAHGGPAPTTTFQVQLHEDGTFACMYLDLPSDNDGIPMRIHLERSSPIVSPKHADGLVYRVGEFGIAGHGVLFERGPPPASATS